MKENRDLLSSVGRSQYLLWKSTWKTYMELRVRIQGNPQAANDLWTALLKASRENDVRREGQREKTKGSGGACRIETASQGAGETQHRAANKCCSDIFFYFFNEGLLNTSTWARDYSRFGYIEMNNEINTPPQELSLFWGSQTVN